MKSIVMLLFFGSILLITVGYVNQLKKCPPPKIEYRYIPRTFQQEQDNPVSVGQLFNNMFEEPSPWIAGFTLGGNASKNQSINRYFISQS